MAENPLSVAGGRSAIDWASVHGCEGNGAPWRPRKGLCLVVDCGDSVRMQIDEINSFVGRMVSAIKSEPAASRSVDLQIVSAGNGTRVELPFQTIDAAVPPTLRAGGQARMNEAIVAAISDIRLYGHHLASAGIPYSKPMLVIVSDGRAADSVFEEEAVRLLADHADHLDAYYVGVGEGFDRECVGNLPARIVTCPSGGGCEAAASCLAQMLFSSMFSMIGHTRMAKPAVVPPCMYVPEEWLI